MKIYYYLDPYEDNDSKPHEWPLDMVPNEDEYVKISDRTYKVNTRIFFPDISQVRLDLRLI